MRDPDRKPGVRLVTDHPGPQAQPEPVTVKAAELAEGDHIALSFGGYGQVIGRVRSVAHRELVVDGAELTQLTVEAPGLTYTTSKWPDADVLIYSAERYGDWL